MSFSLRGARSGAEVTIALDLWPAEFDSGQISQFIANLVVNADQAMPEGGTLRVGCDNFVGPAGEPNSADNLKPGEYIRIKVCGRRFDVVILDLTLPGGMGGKDALKALLEIDPMVNAIFSSGYAPDATMSRYEDLGFRGVIAKPYEAAALGRKVHETIESGRLDTESVYELQHAC